MREKDSNPVVSAVLLLFAIWVMALNASAQSAGTPQPANVAGAGSVPSLVKISGRLRADHGQPLQGLISVTFALYREQEGGAPLWLETQNVEADAQGIFSALLGANHPPDGVPVDLFVNGEARWLGMQAEGQAEQPRMLLVSVPYVLPNFMPAPTAVPSSSSEFPKKATAQIASENNSIGPQAAAAGATSVAAAGATNFTDNTSDQVILVQQNGTGNGIYTTAVSGDALRAEAMALSGRNYAMWGISHGDTGVGVRGEAGGALSSIGAWGVTWGATGTGVLGEATTTAGANWGVRGKTQSTEGTGAAGWALATSGNTVGIQAQVNSPTGTGILVNGTGGKLLSLNTSGVESVSVDGGGNLTIVNPGKFIGDGSGLNNLNSAALTGVLPGAALAGSYSGAITFSNTTNAFNGRFTGDGSGLTSLNPAALTGVLPSAALAGSYSGAMTFSNAANTFNGKFTGDGSGLTNISASQITAVNASQISGVVPDDDLPANIARLNSSNTFVGAQVVNGTHTVNGNQTVNGSVLAAGGLGSASAILDAGTGQAVFMRDDQDTVHSYYSQAGSQMHFRLSRSVPALIQSQAKDFLIAPYSYGMEIDYPGWIEAASRSFSVHANPNFCIAGLDWYNEDACNAGGRLWVGDWMDYGGLYVSAWLPDSATTAAAAASGYVLLAADTFAHLSHGEMRFAVRSPADSFKFQFGAANQEVTQAKLGSDGKGYFNGGVQATGAGYSQSVSVTGGATNYQPGDLLAIDPSASRSFTLASTPYSTLVAGVYASTPGAIVTAHSLDDTSGAGEVPLAVTGIVPCYASAENGAIQPGDLLVSSSTPGYVMKGTDPTQMLGAVVGKALDPLPAGTGTILILVGFK